MRLGGMAGCSAHSVSSPTMPHQLVALDSEGRMAAATY